MSGEKTNEVTALETLQKSLVDLTAETMKSNLTEAIKELESFERGSELNSSAVKQVYKNLMEKAEHLKNLIEATDTINKFINDENPIYF